MHGFVDANEAREIIETINTSSEAIKQNGRVISNTTHIVKAILDEEEKQLKNLQYTLKQFYAETITKIDVIFKRRDLLSIRDSLISEYITLIHSIDQAFTAQSSNQIPKIIQSDNFISQFHSIVKSLKPGTTFPIDVFEEDITEIFKIASLHTRRVGDTILLKITLPICESEPQILFKATPTPIVTDNSFLITDIKNVYFIVNEKKTEFTEMSDYEIRHGINLRDDAMLYKIKILTETNPRMNCIWSRFLHNNLGELKSICNFNPIQKSNYITTINENDLFYITIIKPMIIWETCGNNERQYQINNTGILQTKPNCMIKTEDYIIKPHDNIVLNYTTSILPFLHDSLSSTEIFKNITNSLPIIDSKTELKIINSKSDIEALRTEAIKLINSAEKKINLKKLEYDSSWVQFSFSWLQLGYFLATVLTFIFMTTCACIFMQYRNFKIWKCLFNLCKQKEKNENIQLKSKSRESKRTYRKTPYVERRNMEENIIIEEENE